MIQNNLVSTYSELLYLVGIFVFILGTALGSFINVLVDRVIKGETMGGRSHCDHCKKTLRWFELIPILSFFLIRGKCTRCHTKLSFEHPLIEIITGLLFVGTWLCVPMSSLILYWGIVSCAWVIFLSDVRYQLISDYMQAAFFLGIFLLKIIERATFFSLAADVFAGVMVALPIGLIFVVSNERAMGLGDVILAAIIGFALGIVRGLLGVYIAFLLGAVVGMILLIGKKKGMKSAVPFGPFLLIGMAVAALYGERLIAIARALGRW